VVVRQQPATHAAQFGAGHDQVDLPLLQQELGCLKALWQLLADRLLDDVRSREADPRPRLGQDDIAQHGKRGAHATVGWIGQERDERHSALG
jgi:hypothetical protein